MSVRIKALLVISLTFFILLGVLYFTMQGVLYREALANEQINASQDLTRIKESLNEQVATMDSNVGDWSPWDDTYEFINGNNPAYIDSNLPNVTFTNLGVELMLFIDNSGQIVFGKMIDFTSETEIPIPDGIASQLHSGSVLLSHKDPMDRIAGIIALSDGPMIIASQPIVTSQGSGPIRGTLIMGKRLDEEVITRLEQQTQLSFNIFPHETSGLPADVVLAHSTLNDETSIFVAPLSKTIVAGYSYIYDIYGKPAYILKVESPRDFYTQARISLRFMGIALLVVSLILGLVTWFLLDKLVITRLTSLTTNVKKIGSQGATMLRLNTTGNDEISGLASSVNSMLDSIENAQKKEQESKDQLNHALQSASMGIWQIDLIKNIRYFDDQTCHLLGLDCTSFTGTQEEFWAVVHPEDLDIVRASLVRTVEQDALYEPEYRTIWPDGSIHQVVSRGRLIRDENGTPVRINGVVWDITEEKLAEEALRQSEAELRALFASMHDVVLVIDNHGIYRKIAPTNPGLLVKKPDELLNKSLQDVFPAELAKDFLKVVHQVLESKQTAKIEYELLINDVAKQFETSISPMTEDSTLWVAHDITQRKRYEQVQHAIYRISQAVITSEGIDSLYHSIHSILGELIQAENFFIALFDPVNDMISFPYYVDQVDEPPTEMSKVQGLTGYVLRTGHPLLATREIFDRLVEEGEVEAVGTPGVDWMGAPLKTERGMIGVIAVQSYTEDIHFNNEDLNLLEFVSTQVAQAIERKRMEEEIRSLSLTDELTGLYNRRGFTLLAEREVKLARRIKKNMLMFFFDVNNLKIINDTHGHAQGDQALRDLAAILKETFREADIIARIGGDEFAALAVDASLENVDSLTDRIQFISEKSQQMGYRPWQLTFSMGFAPFNPASPNTLRELISRADSLMYTQKQANKGKNSQIPD